MNIIAQTYDGRQYDLGHPVNMELCSSYDTPADSFNAMFAVIEPLPELSQISVTNDSATVFKGSVDEQEHICKSSGLYLKIIARSYSQLLDNEAAPAAYNRCSLEDIYNIHLKPYGIPGVLGEGRCEGDFVVDKGSCEWAVVEDFCNSVFKIQPRITRDGYLDARQDVGNETPIKIGNYYGADYNYTEASVKYRRYGIVGEIICKTDSSAGYSQSISNESALQRGIKTRRYVNLSGTSKWARQYKLSKTFSDSLKAACEIEVKIPFDFFCEAGSLVNFKDDRLGTFENMRIFEITHSLTNSQISCSVILRPSEHVKG